MRYLLFILAMLSATCLQAQQGANNVKTADWQYYYLDTNKYIWNKPLSENGDSINKILKLAETTSDYDLTLRLKLILYVKSKNEHLISTDSAVYRLLKLSAEAHEKNYKHAEACALQALGDLYSDNTVMQTAAVEQYNAAYAVYRNLDKTQFPEKQTYMFKMGLMYYRYEDYGHAISCLKEARQIEKAIRQGLFCTITNTIGACFRSMKQYDSAIYYFQQVTDTAKKINEDAWVGISQGNIGITYFLQKKYDKAEPLLIKDIETSTANTALKNAVNSLSVLATIYYEQNKQIEAQQLLLQALTFSHQKNFWGDYTLAQKLYEQLHKVYAAQKQYALSNLYADSAIIAKDSIISRNNILSLCKSFQKQNLIKKKFEDEKVEAQAKLSLLSELAQQQLLYKFIIGFLIIVLSVAILVNRLRGRLTTMSAAQGDTSEVVIQKMSIVYISIATCVAALVWTGLYYYYYGLCLITVLPFCYFLLVGPSLIIYFFTKKQLILVNTQLFCIFFITLMIECFSGGFKGGVVILWAFLAPVGALMYQGVRQAAVWMGMFILAIIILAVFHDYFAESYHPISETAQYMFDCMNIIGPCIVIYFSMQYYVKSLTRDGRLLLKNNTTLSDTLGELTLEKQKSDNLLLNILPIEVAEELKAKGSTTARYYDNVTVMFTDFVDFTVAGEHMSPQDLVDELNTCFKAFDEITAKYNIEKIKTVGDAYIAVAGLPTPLPNHAELVIRAAIEINNFIINRQAQKPENTFHMRIGVHSGSVVAGIVGVKKFAYDIWGDTVNTAARMEQSSEAGKINISHTTYELVKDNINCTYRGEMEVKGKGQLKMYYVS
jgi:class 3 adenylate cyclase/tetratricopeptide (TPR) repeat protein